MNWLTSPLLDVGTQRLVPEVAARAQSLDGSTLRAIPYDVLMATYGLPETDTAIRDGFLLCEDTDSASARADLARELSMEERPRLFTLAIDYGYGFVLYLPEDRDDLEEVQLFIDYGGTLNRVRAEAVAGPDGTVVEFGAVTQDGPGGACSDGPCKDWGAGCGQGCQCHKFEVHDAASEHLLSLLSRSKTRKYALRCA